MYSIPAPIIKTILDYCDLPTAIAFARVTKRCSSIFKQYREEILLRGEYVNVTNMFRYCSDEFIIRMSRHEFFDISEARKCCRKMRYHLYEKMGMGKLYSNHIDKNLLLEIYEKNEYNNILSATSHKLQAAKLGIELDIPYPDNIYGLHAALLLRDKKMINKLSNYGDFFTYCITGYYHLADNYDVEHEITCVNFSNDPVAAFNYIEKRGFKFEECDYFEFENYELIKMILPRITKFPAFYIINTTDYDTLMMLCNKLLEFTTIENIFDKVVNKNINFTRYLLQTYKNLPNGMYRFKGNFILNLLDLIDNKKIMKYACKYNKYYLIRALIKRNNREWANQYNHPFIKEYYS